MTFLSDASLSLPGMPDSTPAPPAFQMGVDRPATACPRTSGGAGSHSNTDGTRSQALTDLDGEQKEQKSFPLRAILVIRFDRCRQTDTCH